MGVATAELFLKTVAGTVIGPPLPLSPGGAARVGMTGRPGRTGGRTRAPGSTGPGGRTRPGVKALTNGDGTPASGFWPLRSPLPTALPGGFTTPPNSLIRNITSALGLRHLGMPSSKMTLITPSPWLRNIFCALSSMPLSLMYSSTSAGLLRFFSFSFSMAFSFSKALCLALSKALSFSLSSSRSRSRSRCRSFLALFSSSLAALRSLLRSLLQLSRSLWPWRLP
mmetsp:Transcript_96690/g.215475  ORF Transcript_96690/g.215475 Transcript_96690/m.215475 type:complete len:225 (+) Transcript_96690:103-777(+)